VRTLGGAGQSALQGADQTAANLGTALTQAGDHPTGGVLDQPIGSDNLAAGRPGHLAADAVVGLVHPAWQALLALCLLVVTLLGIRRLAVRGPTRVTNAVFVTGFLIVAIGVVGTLVVSCSTQDGSRSTSEQGRP
jgi:hypothetical protein